MTHTTPGQTPPQTRTESDTMGTVQVAADRLWGAQTERSISNFPFGERERMPAEIVHALGADALLVGVDQSSQYPPSMRTLPQVGYYRNFSVVGVS